MCASRSDNTLTNLLSDIGSQDKTKVWHSKDQIACYRSASADVCCFLQAVDEGATVEVITSALHRLVDHGW
jgi:hypothetical protein